MTPVVTKVSVRDVIGSPIAVSTEKAQRVYELLRKGLDEGEITELSFDGIQNVITAFLNTAVGQLYGKYPSQKVRTRLRVTDATPEIEAMLKRTTDNAERFFKNPEPYRQAYRQLAQP